MPTTKLAGDYWSSFENRKMLPNQTRLRLSLGAMVLMLIVSVGATYWFGRSVIQSNERIIHQQSLVKEVDATLSAMKDVETGQRDYLLTGDESSLKPYHDSFQELRQHLENLRAMTRILVGFGHRVEVAYSVAGGLALSRDQPFDLLLSDIGLPDGTGIDLVRKIHAERPLLAVALTGFGMEDDVVRCRQAGFSAHLAKPVNLRALQVVIEEVTGGRNET